MISKYKHKGLTWIDIESPSHEEIAYILDEFAIPLFVKDFLSSSPKENIVKIESGFIFSFLNLPTETPDVINRLIFITSDIFTIIIHDKPIRAIREFSSKTELESLMNNDLFKGDNKLLFAHLLKNLYLDSQKQLFLNELKYIKIKKQLLRNKKRFRLLLALFLIFFIITLLMFLYVLTFI